MATILKNKKIRYLKNWPILMKFGMLMQIGLPNRKS